MPGEFHDVREMSRQARQAVVAAIHHDLRAARVAADGLAVVQHLVTGLHQEKIPARRDPGYLELFPFAEMALGKLVRLPGVEVPLRPEIRTQPDVRLDRGIDEHGFRAARFGEGGGVEATERGADEAGLPGRQARLDHANGVGGKRRQRWAAVAGCEAALRKIVAEQLGLVRLRRRVESVQIDDHAPFRRRASSFSWMPPKPPFDITSTWSPVFASPATASTSASRLSSQRARCPSGANTALASQPRPALYT